MLQNYRKIIYRPWSNAYVINDGLLCVPCPADETIPASIREQYADLWDEVHAHALAHPEEVTEEQPWSPSLDDVKAVKLAAIATAYESSLTATLTMPSESPTPAEIAAEAALFAVEDAAGLADVRAILAARRDELKAAVEAAATVEEVEALVLSFPV